MSILSGLETVFEGVVDGTFRRLFSPPLQPVEIARALERVMLRQRVVGPTSIDVPNAFVARVNPRDYDRLLELRSTVERNVAAHLDRRAVEEGLHPVGPIHVSMLPDPLVARSTVKGEATFDEVSMARTTQLEHTRRFEPVDLPPGKGTLILVAEDGSTVTVRDHSITVGRGADNDLVIRDLRVSRHHLAVEPGSRGWMVRDLQTTNGTYLDGDRIQEIVVDTPAELSLGGHVLTFRLS
jgi:hypothetical protein